MAWCAKGAIWGMGELGWEGEQEGVCRDFSRGDAPPHSRDHLASTLVTVPRPRGALGRAPWNPRPRGDTPRPQRQPDIVGSWSLALLGACIVYCSC